MHTLSLRRCFLPPPSAPSLPCPLFSGDISHPSPVTSFLRPLPCGGCLSAPSALPFYFPLMCFVREEEACCGAMLMYRNQRSLRRTWWRLFLTTLSRVDREVRRWYARVCAMPHLTIPSKQCDTAPFLQQATHSFGASPIPPPKYEIKTKCSTYIPRRSCKLLLCFFAFLLGVHYCPEREYIYRGVVGVVRG